MELPHSPIQLHSFRVHKVNFEFTPTTNDREIRQTLIVGLNVATKGALPFSRGKRVVPGKRDVPFRPFLASKKQY
jgi:hypothetical protein